MYGQYKSKTQKTCKGAYQEAKSAYDAATGAKKESELGMKLADKALSATNMEDAKKCLKQLEDRHKIAHELIKISEERKKEVEFEMKGCN